METDVVIVGTGVGGLFSALCLPEDKQIVMITKSDLESSDSFLAQGGMCVQRDDEDYDGYFEDTMRAGHYENRKESVDLMIRGSRDILKDLIRYGVDFERDQEGNLRYTREGAHSRPRIVFHKDITGKEITSTLLARVQERDNIQLYEYTTMTDLIEEEGVCRGIVAQTAQGEPLEIRADYTILASGVTKENIQRLTSLGVDYISSGALTHSAPILDISLKHLHPL